jgi:hypothetical protein
MTVSTQTVAPTKVVSDAEDAMGDFDLDVIKRRVLCGLLETVSDEGYSNARAAEKLREEGCYSRHLGLPSYAAGAPTLATTMRNQKLRLIE